MQLNYFHVNKSLLPKQVIIIKVNFIYPVFAQMAGTWEQESLRLASSYRLSVKAVVYIGV